MKPIICHDGGTSYGYWKEPKVRAAYPLRHMYHRLSGHERSIYAHKKVKTENRSTMGNEKLNSLMLL
ncbi:hypothetical protein TNCV_3466051 [Trichonephila clavipes]|nr:hypothetical protein TNCV_3466051 [Trichonephila clavipes]